ncbi:SDR family oxidoreductase [Priestia megaterium]|uniref:dTDP-4-dehydrorhamnose reductase family protein n=1 Tax=Priestia megaterium TaxID=1404 RepID=UPI002E213863|nr:SDR family oxidoreductase [Priestia megaterium]
MKLLILGGRGMAGHMLTEYFNKKKNYKVYYTSRQLNDKNGIYLDVRDYPKLNQLFNEIDPDLVINATGLLNKQASNAKMAAIQVNSLLPHQLVELSERKNAKLIHISTDCVFSGKKGAYTEDDCTDGTSDYAKSKALGEVVNDNHLTIRTSIIGPELKKDGIGLFLWFMKQKGEVRGYTNVFWNGVTTLELAKVIEKMIEQNITGLYNLGLENKISKYELLTHMQYIFQKSDITIIPYKTDFLDRTIKSNRHDFHYSLPSYSVMLTELREWMKGNSLSHYK